MENSKYLKRLGPPKEQGIHKEGVSGRESYLQAADYALEAGSDEAERRGKQHPI